MWTTYPGTLRLFNSFLILLNLEKDLQPEQSVTIKISNRASRGWINQEPLIQGIRPTRVFATFFLFPCLVGGEFCGCQLTKSLLLAIQYHQDL